MQTTSLALLALAIVLAACVQSDLPNDENPVKGTYKERFYLPAERRAELAIRASGGDALAARQLFLHYRIADWIPDEATKWASRGAALGDATCSKFMREQSRKRR